MNAICVVQARTGSSRLPGKVLADLGGRPLLGLMLDRLAGAGLPIVVATTHLMADDTVADLADGAGFSVVRGPEQDVLARFGLVLDRHRADVVVRLTADCPLVDPALVQEAVALRAAAGAAYASNTLVRTYPDGLDVEVVTADALRAATAEAVEAAEREHVTPFIYRRPARFRLRSLRTDNLAGDERWTVDTADDLEAMRAVVERLGPRATTAGWEDVLAAAGRRARTPRLRLRPAVEDDSHIVLRWRNDPDAVRFSGSGKPVDPRSHRAWFANLLVEPGSRLWIGEKAGRPVGQTRIDVADGVATVSVAVAPDVRGQGIGAGMVEALHDALLADLQVVRLVAHVRAENTASLRTFARAGYDRVGRLGALVTMGRSLARPG